MRFDPTDRPAPATATTSSSTTRRRFLRGLGTAAAACLLPDPLRLLASESGAAAGDAQSAGDVLTKAIPSTGERIPVLGMGTWITFNVPPIGGLLDTRVEVLRRFFADGGGMIDSSPMYGQSEKVVGACLERLDEGGGLFSATKVWTPFQALGRGQIEDSHELWGVDRFDLLQVHNLVAWEAHLETLRERKAAGRLRYVGVTTSHGRRHDELEAVMKSQPLDFVQLTYNILDREPEARLLPLAADRGIAVIANRPFRRGALIDRFRGEPLPPWAADIGCATWPQFLLKFIISHPALTCAIPATAEPAHMSENRVAGRGELPDAKTREKMVRWVEGL